METSLSSPSEQNRFFDQLKSGHRAMVSLHGSVSWAARVTQHIWSTLDVGSTLECGARAHDLGVFIRPSEAHQYLGREYDALFFDLSEAVHPDALAILVSCVRGPGIICLYWGCADAPVPVDRHLGVEGSPPFAIGHRLRKHLMRQTQRPPHFQIEEGTDWSLSRSVPKLQWKPNTFEWTEDQRAAKHAIVRVRTGRNRRPLILEAPRGRGKSTVLGHGIATIVELKRTHVVVILQHAHSALPLTRRLESDLNVRVTIGEPQYLVNGSSVHVMTMAQALDTQWSADMLFVDEAATFPVHILMRFLEICDRAVFATTTAGYEGTGQGFRLRFDAELRLRFRDRRIEEMVTPVRWCALDPVEAWLNSSFFLDDRTPVDEADLDAVRVMAVDRTSFSTEPSYLRQVFQLLSRAHYRTTPADLHRMLDAPNMRIWIARVGSSVVGVCLVSEEGGLSASMADEIYQAKRRPRGHLLPETLCVHGGSRVAVTSRSWRVVRIAVERRFRLSGIGRRLLGTLEEAAPEFDIDYLGASFGATPTVCAFWRSAGFEVVRLGIRRGKSSGLYSAVVVKPLNPLSLEMVATLRRRFSRFFPACLSEALRDLDATTAWMLIQGRDMRLDPELTPDDREEFDAFMRGYRSFELVSPALERVLTVQITKIAHDLIVQDHKTLIIQKVFQRKPWSKISLSNRTALSRGHGQALLREAIDTISEGI